MEKEVGRSCGLQKTGNLVWPERGNRGLQRCLLPLKLGWQGIGRNGANVNDLASLCYI